ncbi:extracellular calcium-sensing receptor-like [Pleurodeles waltl]|uniref:extracellular calcium-sensing receptor-like n=1 Tax=Pleurodeles waltl TaxID=8319 RepID=UPI0037098DF5
MLPAPRPWTSQKYDDPNDPLGFASLLIPPDVADFGVPFSVTTYGCVLAMVFAIDEINGDQTILPNLTLGTLIYNTCSSAKKAIISSLQMLTGQESPIPNYRCKSSSPLIAVIGESSSTISVSIARLFGLYTYPQVSYFSTSPLLDNKYEFPSFFRTIPSDDSQAQGLAQLVVHFGWTWVGIVSNEDDYGRLGSQSLKEQLLKYGVCFAFHESIPIEPSIIKINLIVKTIVSSSASVILAFCSSRYLLPIMRALSQQNMTGKVWVASEGWATSSSFPSSVFGNTMSEIIGLTVHAGAIPGFQDFLLKVHPSNYPKDKFVKTFWEQAMGCRWPIPGSNMTLKSKQNISDTAICTGQEKLEKFKAKYENEPDPRVFSTIYNAVYALTYALKNMLSCVPGHGSFALKTCGEVFDSKPWQVWMGEEIFFDKYGSPPAAYDIVNWQHEPDGIIRYVKVGSFEKREPRGQELNVNKSALWWTKQGKEAPHSVCSEKCNTGYHKAGRKGQPACCFDCVPCSEGQMSKERDSSKCWPCPSDQWPDRKRSDCVPKRLEVLSYTDPVGATLSAAVLLCSIITMILLIIFIKFQETAVVKANNRNLTYLLILSLVLSFLFSLLFIGEPQPITCFLRQTAFGIMFALCISCVLAKTIMVFIAFNATKPGSSTRRWLGPRISILTVSVCTLIQVIICATWLLLCPPFPEKNMKLKIGTIIHQCNECSVLALWCVLGYLGLLACISFLLAFLVRKLPDSFNEAKWITFSMIVFLSVWLSFIPGYLSTQGKYMVAVEVFSIICSCAGILVCIFLPKCYIILLRPDLNTREHLLGKKSS